MKKRSNTNITNIKSRNLQTLLYIFTALLIVMTILLRTSETNTLITVSSSSFVYNTATSNELFKYNISTIFYLQQQLEQCTLLMNDKSFPTTLLPSTQKNEMPTATLSHTIKYPPSLSRGVLFHPCRQGICGSVLTHITSSSFVYDRHCENVEDFTSRMECITQQRQLWNTTRGIIQPSGLLKKSNCSTGSKLFRSKIGTSCQWCPMIHLTQQHKYSSSTSTMCLNGTLFARDIFEQDSTTSSSSSSNRPNNINKNNHYHQGRITSESSQLANRRSWTEEYYAHSYYHAQYKTVWIYCQLAQHQHQPKNIQDRKLPNNNNNYYYYHPLGILTINDIGLTAMVNSRSSSIGHIDLRTIASNNNNNINDINLVCILSPPMLDITTVEHVQQFVHYYINKLGFSHVIWYLVGLSPHTMQNIMEYDFIRDLIETSKLIVIDLRNELQNLYGPLATDPLIFSHENAKYVLRTDCLHRARNFGHVQWILFTMNVFQYLVLPTIQENNMVSMMKWSNFTSLQLQGIIPFNKTITWIHFPTTMIELEQPCRCNRMDVNFASMIHNNNTSNNNDPVLLSSVPIGNKKKNNQSYSKSPHTRTPPPPRLQQQQQQQYLPDHVAIRLNNNHLLSNNFIEWTHDNWLNPNSCMYDGYFQIPSNIAIIKHFHCPDLVSSSSSKTKSEKANKSKTTSKTSPAAARGDKLSCKSSQKRWIASSMDLFI
jgi:hypothetical protein